MLNSPYRTECLKIYRKSILKQMQYRFAVNFGTLSIINGRLDPKSFEFDYVNLTQVRCGIYHRAFSLSKSVY